MLSKLKNSKYRNSEQILVTTQKVWIKYKESNYNFVEVASEMLHYNSAIKATVTQIALKLRHEEHWKKKLGRIKRKRNFILEWYWE